MAITDENSSSDGKVWGLFKLPFRNSVNSNSTTSSSSQYRHQNQQLHSQSNRGPDAAKSQTSSVSSVARSLIPTRRRLRLDPPNKLFFPCKSYSYCISSIFYLFMLSFEILISTSFDVCVISHYVDLIFGTN